MKLAILGNFSSAHTSEQHYAQALTDLGHDVLTLQEGTTTVSGLVSQARSAEVLVWVHTHGLETPGGIVSGLQDLRRHRTRVIAYHLDLWRGLGRERDLTEKHPYLSQVDHFFTVDPGMADWITDHTHAIGHYLPAAVAHRECWMAPAPVRDLKVVFVGSHRYHPEWPYRNKLIVRLHDRYGDDFHLIPGQGQPVRGAALNRLYGRTQVVVGDTLCPGFDYPGYWSDRVYETLGRGGFLIHPRIAGLERQFTDGEHLAYYDYNDFEGLFAIINRYLDEPEERESIRSFGHAEVHRTHLYIHRWQTILETIS